MTEIRRIQDDEDEAEQVVELWDRSCREDPDGGPLTPQGRRNLRRMLAMTAWHRQSFCLVAVATDGASPTRVVGFVCGHITAGDGLLPGVVGELHEMYVEPERADAGICHGRLVEAALTQLRADGAAWTIRSTMDTNDATRRELLAGLGFEPDMITMSLYHPG